MIVYASACDLNMVLGATVAYVSNFSYLRLQGLLTGFDNM